MCQCCPFSLVLVTFQQSSRQYSCIRLPISSTFYITIDSLAEFDNKLKTDKAYRSKVILHLSTIGGKNSKKITMAIMGRIIHCTLTTKYSWKGGKGKRQFCLFNGLLTAVICATRHTKHIDTVVAPDATKDVITDGKQSNRMKETQIFMNMSETEETSILNESGEQSETSLTDVENDSNKHLPDINNKKLVPYVKDSDDYSS
ncbi:uncharacterized protein LOC112457180 [Temnothorax curvispinosus]|uniref:Uncharacterized protein LOC112457180 n=1 Tax=Temnothorax curvispinosus TaxID=300111 RepID=A0A6J1Q151_9HYME|nr:uncharacterized protein LOC112457180 [Temnothorax curvispinosus]